MLLPNADKAVIEVTKLRDYLLSTVHPLGRFKARFFSTLGFAADRWQELESALRTQHLTQEADVVPPRARRSEVHDSGYSDRTQRAIGGSRERLVYSAG